MGIAARAFTRPQYVLKSSLGENERASIAAAVRGKLRPNSLHHAFSSWACAQIKSCPNASAEVRHASEQYTAPQAHETVLAAGTAR